MEHVVELLQLMVVAVNPSKVNPVAPLVVLKPTPVTVTLVPPAAAPEVGEMLVTAGV
jgi:hypothetical protein